MLTNIEGGLYITWPSCYRQCAFTALNSACIAKLLNDVILFPKSESLKDTVGSHLHSLRTRAQKLVSGNARLQELLLARTFSSAGLVLVDTADDGYEMW